MGIEDNIGEDFLLLQSTVIVGEGLEIFRFTTQDEIALERIRLQREQADRTLGERLETGKQLLPGTVQFGGDGQGLPPIDFQLMIIDLDRRRAQSLETGQQFIEFGLA